MTNLDYITRATASLTKDEILESVRLLKGLKTELGLERYHDSYREWDDESGSYVTTCIDGLTLETEETIPELERFATADTNGWAIFRHGSEGHYIYDLSFDDALTAEF